MASITSSGIGSGLDINGLVSQLVAAERAPTTQRLAVKEAKLQAKLSAYGTLKSSLSSFQSAANTLKSLNTFQARSASVSDSTVMTATASSIAQEGSYSVKVLDLAQAHSLASTAGFEDLSTAVGTGSLTFRFGSYNVAETTFTQNGEVPSKTVVIGDADNSLSGIRDAVNAANIGVRASIVNDGSGYRLLFSSAESGASHALEVTVDEGGAPAANEDLSGLSQLVFSATVKNATRTELAQDARVSINGLIVTRPNNVVDGAIPGVTLNLQSTAPDKPVLVEINHDQQGAYAAVDKFVASYNELVATMKSLGDYRADTQTAGVLLGDPALRSVETRLRQVLGQVVEGTGGAYRSLADIGIATQRDGTLSLNANKLQSALDSDFDSVGRLFATSGHASDSLVTYHSASADTRAGSYSLQVDRLATQGSFSGRAGIAAVTLDTGNNAFSVNVDGVQSASLSLSAGTYDSPAQLAGLAAEMTSKINGATALQSAGISVTVSYDSDQQRFVIRSNSYGSASTVSMVSLMASLGLDQGGSGQTGQDVAGSLGGVPATGAGQILTGAGGAQGLNVQIGGGAVGARGDVNFSRGYGESFGNVLNDLLKTQNLLDTKRSGMQTEISAIANERLALDRRMTALQTRLFRQFSAMDALVSQLRSTSDFLTQQLAALQPSSS